jgi:hypothetical protein
MLGLDQDLEADLGIDSIKRVEIVGALQDQLPPILVQTLIQENEDLSVVRTLNGWVDVLMTPPDKGASRTFEPALHENGADAVSNFPAEAIATKFPEIDGNK